MDWLWTFCATHDSGRYCLQDGNIVNGEHCACDAVSRWAICMQKGPGLYCLDDDTAPMCVYCGPDGTVDATAARVLSFVLLALVFAVGIACITCAVMRQCKRDKTATWPSSGEHDSMRSL